jgi:hypothetical protein
MSTPFTVQSTLNLPGTPGLPIDAIVFSMQAQYDSKVELEYNLPASTGTKVVDFGTMPAAGAKAFVLYYETITGAPPLAVLVNGSLLGWELAPGGFILYANPTPATGITAMTLAYTGAGRARLWLLG